MKLNHFSEIIGQDRAISLLENSLAKNQVNHAYLFLGPEGIGKMLTAVTFAHRLIAAADKDAPIFFRENVHPDLMLIEIRESRTVILKEQVTDELEPWLALKPYRSKHRIAIIRDSHLISDEAANALLKTLEEPPSYAVIILVADRDSLLETIISRCQIVRFFPVVASILEKHLISLDVPVDLAANISNLAQGNVALAQRLVTEEDLLDKWQEARAMLKNLASSDISQVFALAEFIEIAPDLFINMLEIILRDILIYKTTSNKDLVIIAENIELALGLEIRDINSLKETINYMGQLKGYYRRYINSKLICINIARSIWEALH
ncbi:MAG TPA: hypothetical protein VFD02_01075 [Syntrophomonadaceae bacterium]|nr:hypothetical protein [Syntrophomonadaceae bacterium]